MIRTIWKDISQEEAGHAQCHEHIWLTKGASCQKNPALCIDDRERSLQELKDYRLAGGRLIVDAQPTGCGCSARMLAELSMESGVYIVACAGFHKKEFFDRTELLSWPEKALSRLYIREIKEGIPDSGGKSSFCRAGILKAAAGGGWQTDPVYRRLFEAVAHAAVMTGAPVMIHTEKGNDILALIHWFRERGVLPERLLICHLDRTHYDPSYHKEVLSTGCFLCYDSIRRYKYVSEAEELSLLRQMKEAGLLSQIVLSLDTTNRRLRSYGAADMGLDYIRTVYLPLLKEQGFTDSELRQMCIANAGKILNFIPERSTSHET